MKTLFEHKQRPAVQFISMVNEPLPDVVARLLKSNKLYDGSAIKGAEFAVPEEDALWFYTSNAIMAKISGMYDPYDDLPDDVNALVNEYHEIVKYKSLRMFHYLLLICTRESRHDHRRGEPSWQAQLNANYGTGDFHRNIAGGSETAVQYLRDKAPKTTLGKYTQHLVDVFYKGKYGSSYGGKKWGVIADCLNECVQGRSSLELMLDTSFTLAHNGGPIFNKGMLFHHYKPTLKTILDVQRSGQCPEWIKQKKEFSSSALQNFLEKAEKILGLNYQSYVDWYKVKALGGLGDHTSAYTFQKKQYGKSPMDTGVSSVEKKDSPLPWETTPKPDTNYTGSEFFVMPGLSLPIIKHTRKTANV